MKKLFLITVLVCIVCFENFGQEWKAISPDGAIEFNLQLKDGKLVYSVSNSGDVVVGKSSLGIQTNTDDFTNGLEKYKIYEAKISGSYNMLIGKQSNISYKGNSLDAWFKKNNKELEIQVRVFNDGVAFRYNLQGKGSSTVFKETTDFNIGEGTAWLQRYGNDPNYEEPYENGIATGTPAKDSTGWSLPSIFHTNNNWVLLTEANNDTNYCGSHLAPNSENGFYHLAFPLASEASGMFEVNPTAKLPFATPWRVIITGKTTAAIAESNLVYTLSEPSKIKDVSWIKPGRSSWSWWSDHASSKDYNTLTRFVDFCKDMHWEYSLVDANWNIMKNGNINQLIDYAKSKNVGLTLWYNSAGPYNDVSEQPRDKMYDPVTRKAEFKKLHNLGVKAVKVDFFGGEKQQMFKQYIGILNDAAAEHIMVIFHGCTFPRGWSRTYPNLLSMEGIRGAEQYWSDDYAKYASAGNTIVALTRNVVGPMDYTPVAFSSPYAKHTTTNTHELALSVVFESGMLHFADSDSSYKAQKPEVISYLQQVPNTWDETKLIKGMPGKEVIIARRKGSTWYIAGINGEAQSKQYIFSIADFVKAGNYSTTIFLDDENDAHNIVVKEATLPSQNVSVSMAANGGFVAVLKPE